MAFTLEATVGGTTLNLSNSSPYFVRSAKGMAGSEVRRVTTRGPAQHGDTDAGYRLIPRQIELEIGYIGATDALVDEYRDTLTSFFKPFSDMPIYLTVTRDDGSQRQLDTFVVGGIDIDLVPEYRNGHHQIARIRLYAPDSAYYSPTAGTVDASGTVSIGWWLAGGAIGTAQVLMSGGTPSGSATWSYAGNIGTATGYTLVFQVGPETPTGTAKYLYAVDSSGGGTAGDSGDVYYGIGTAGYFEINGNLLGTVASSQADANYMVSYDPNQFYQNEFIIGVGTTDLGYLAYWSGTAPITSATRKWRVDRSFGTAWVSTIHKYALYSPALTLDQKRALNHRMSYDENVVEAPAVVYNGDLPEYPVINITGPIINLNILNTANGMNLNFPGTIGAGTTYVINTHPLYKTVMYGTVNKRGELSNDSDLEEWRIEPAPIAVGGTNTISITGSGAGTATAITIVYYNRYWSY